MFVTAYGTIVCLRHLGSPPLFRGRDIDIVGPPSSRSRPTRITCSVMSLFRQGRCVWHGYRSVRGCPSRKGPHGPDNEFHAFGYCCDSPLLIVWWLTQTGRSRRAGAGQRRPDPKHLPSRIDAGALDFQAFDPGPRHHGTHLHRGLRVDRVCDGAISAPA